ncbi:MAG: class I SAM-dependent methyltransferase [Paucibacter sp.]|nr:class I SAM-dependent methyltransferase [Roseateles sp.]
MSQVASTAAAIHWVEQGMVPDRVVRLGIRRLLRQRLDELQSGDPQAQSRIMESFIEGLKTAPLALLPEKANEQHYELPPEFFSTFLGPHRKYSCCWWPDGVDTLEEAEVTALSETCTRAGLADGQDILELGCGWGSLSLWMASHFPRARITAVSNSHSQRAYIAREARRRGISNLEVVTSDINNFDTGHRFDRIVSIEMFEHLRNWSRAFERVAEWLRPHGRFFMHVFSHRGAPYAFESRDASDWMSRHFFAGGMMPSDDLALRFQDDLRVLQQWRWNGRHYARTAAAWLERMDSQRRTLMPILTSTYGEEADQLWWTRWRLFFMSVEELFGYADGGQWWVSHYLFEQR